MSIFIAGVEVLIFFIFKKKKILSGLHMYLFIHADVSVCVRACIHDWMHISARGCVRCLFLLLATLFVFVSKLGAH